MKTYQLINRRVDASQSVLDWIFIVCGGKFYLDWILPTNPVSRNPVIRFLWGWLAYPYSAVNYKSRYNSAIIVAIIHTVGAVAYFKTDVDIIPNLLVNIYPIIV